jgi:hypothetical protein
MRRQAWREGAQVHLRSRGRRSFSSSSLLDAELADADEGWTVSARPVSEAQATHRFVRCLFVCKELRVFPGSTAATSRAPGFRSVGTGVGDSNPWVLNPMGGECGRPVGDGELSRGLLLIARCRLLSAKQTAPARLAASRAKLIGRERPRFPRSRKGSQRPERKRESTKPIGQGAEFDVFGTVALPSRLHQTKAGRC